MLITSAWRNILRHKLFSFINILGLAIGLAAVMLIALYVRYETSYDNFWKNADNIYRLHTQIQPPGQDPMKRVSAPAPAVVAMKETFPEITDYTRLAQGVRTLSIGDKKIQQNISFVDTAAKDIFDFTIISGDIKDGIQWFKWSCT